MNQLHPRSSSEHYFLKSAAILKQADCSGGVALAISFVACLLANGAAGTRAT
jgi:hypothetical protein